MENRKINVDRPQLNANEVMAGKNFDTVLRNHEFMSKPFYKQGWFFGTAGLASLGLIIGGTLAFQGSAGDYQLSEQMLNTDAPPNLTVLNPSLIVSGGKINESTQQLPQKTIRINPQNIAPIEETSTQTEKIEPRMEVQEKFDPAADKADKNITESTNEQSNVVVLTNTDKNEGVGNFDMSPRISNKMGGTITRNELLDNKGITTEGDINVIHFELHLIDGLGGKVFTEEGNQLNQEMRDALENVEQGETIYFENIRGKVKNGAEVRLNPLRYVLKN